MVGSPFGIQAPLRVILAMMFLFVAGTLLRPVPARAEKHWLVTGYSAVIIEADMVTLPWNLHRSRPEFRMAALAVARELGTWNETIGFELEGQVAWGIEGNDHTELNALVVFRWLRFPWDPWLETSFAFGPGVSFANEVPLWERSHFRETNRVLGYILWELEFYLPRVPALRVVSRVHHRSGVYGTFNGVYAGSNFAGFGLKVAL